MTPAGRWQRPRRIAAQSRQLLRRRRLPAIDWPGAGVAAIAAVDVDERRRSDRAIGPGHRAADVGARRAGSAVADRDRRAWVGVSRLRCSAISQGVRIAWSRNLGRYPVEPVVNQVCDAARHVFTDIGCVVEDGEPDFAGADETSRPCAPGRSRRSEARISCGTAA